jgi:catechol 2,3-dioxygenase-like lactoylglutathione lyase family enzyme
MSSPGMIESISAITLATHDMTRAVRFYRALGFEIIYGGDAAGFTSFRAGRGYLNLIAQPPKTQWSWWGRVIFYHSDVDALLRRSSGQVTAQARRRAMLNGESDSST